MKIRISLLVACLIVMGIPTSIDAAIDKNNLSPQSSARAKNLEEILHKSGICKDYPSVIKISDDNTVIVATYADRKLSDIQIKVLAFNIAKLVLMNVENAKEIKVRLYDPASTMYWRDILFSAAQMREALKPESVNEQALQSVKVVNNCGLVDGPNLETRVALLKQILILQRKGVESKPYLAKLQQIETTDKNKRDITALVAELNKSLTEMELSLTKPLTISSNTNELEDTLRQYWQDTCAGERAALKELENDEQELNSLNLPEAYDNDAQVRYETLVQALKQKVAAAVASWHEACQIRDIAYQEYTLNQAKHH